MSKHYKAKKYTFSSGVGVSEQRLSSFDKALIAAGVGNYNLVRLSSILPAHCEKVPAQLLPLFIEEGSLLPTAYATISCSEKGKKIASAIGVGYPVDKDKVGVIMEYSAEGITGEEAAQVVIQMIEEAFIVRGWEMDGIEHISSEAEVEQEDTTVSTFACIAEW